MAACASKTAVIAEPAEVAKLDRGVLTSSSWESSQWNLRFELPDGYLMATREELDALSKSSEERIKQYNIDASYMKDSAITMMALSSVVLPSVMVGVEELAYEMSLAEYIEKTKNIIKTAVDLAYEWQEFTIYDNLTTIRIAGEEYTVLKMEIQAHGVTLIMDYAIRKSGSQLLTITTMYIDGMQANVAELLSGFSTRLPLAMVE
jgi:hypothetical protein